MYLTISEIAANSKMALRVAGAYAAEGGTEQAQMWATNHNFRWAATPGWAEAWELASTATGAPPDPQASITDEMIRARVVELMAVPTPLSQIDADPSNLIPAPPEEAQP